MSAPTLGSCSIVTSHLYSCYSLFRILFLLSACFPSIRPYLSQPSSWLSSQSQKDNPHLKFRTLVQSGCPCRNYLLKLRDFPVEQTDRHNEGVLWLSRKANLFAMFDQLSKKALVALSLLAAATQATPLRASLVVPRCPRAYCR